MTSNKKPALTLRQRLFQPVDIASLVFFRIAFGAILVWEAWRYFSRGWIERYYIDPLFHFSYFGFDWVRPWPGEWMYVHFAVFAILAGCVMAGLAYRITAPLFFLAFTYVFLLDQTQYLNHFYLISLVAFLLCFIPAHRAFSLDARLRPKLRSQTTPAWTVWILRAQLGIAYFYGGVAKLNSDWLQGEPMRDWLAGTTDFPLIGRFFTQEWAVYFFSYGGLLFDLLIVPMLIWKRTRMLGFALAVTFHVLNSELFSIGIFPWLMIAATLIFMEPDWPRRFASSLGVRLAGEGRKAKKKGQSAGAAVSAAGLVRQRLALGLLGAYMAIQVLVPFRHWLYPGNVSWTEEGHRFSWHMKLRDKDARIRFRLTEPNTGRTWEVRPRDFLSSRQIRKMANRPDMILQFAHYLAQRQRDRGYSKIEVRVHSLASLNGRRYQLLIDPNVDLAQQPRSLRHASYILPLKEPLFREQRPALAAGGE